MCIGIVQNECFVAGREDMDVRMLGEGRPFVMEIINQRAEVPGPEFFVDVEARLKAVGPAVCMYVKTAKQLRLSQLRQAQCCLGDADGSVDCP